MSGNEMIGQIPGVPPSYPVPVKPETFADEFTKKAIKDAQREALRAKKAVDSGAASKAEAEKHIKANRAKAANQISDVHAAEEKTGAGMIAALVVAGGALLYLLMKGK